MVVHTESFNGPSTDRKVSKMPGPMLQPLLRAVNIPVEMLCMHLQISGSEKPIEGSQMNSQQWIKLVASMCRSSQFVFERNIFQQH